YMAILKLFHVLAVFIWIGTQLMLSRLIAYLPLEEKGVQHRLQRILKRIYQTIDFPSMCVAVGLGLTSLLLKETNWKAPWLHLKLTCAFLLILCDLVIGRSLIWTSSYKPWVYRLIHTLEGICLLGILIAIYLLKNLF
ncbi:MAG: CopD family protein, partial [Chlamydiia bacterium]|nr:CopD family protein [Chlamydiia bacterium]